MSTEAAIAALKARLDAMEATNQQLERLVKDQGSLIPIRQQEDARLHAIRMESIFKVIDQKIPNRSQGYGFRLYRKDGEIINSVVAVSEEDKALKLEEGWFVNPAGVPDKPKRGRPPVAAEGE